jgi:hypothetical protein
VFVEFVGEINFGKIAGTAAQQQQVRRLNQTSNITSPTATRHGDNASVPPVGRGHDVPEQLWVYRSKRSSFHTGHCVRFR